MPWTFSSIVIVIVIIIIIVIIVIAIVTVLPTIDTSSACPPACANSKARQLVTGSPLSHVVYVSRQLRSASISSLTHSILPLKHATWIGATEALHFGSTRSPVWLRSSCTRVASPSSTKACKVEYNGRCSTQDKSGPNSCWLIATTLFRLAQEGPIFEFLWWLGCAKALHPRNLSAPRVVLVIVQCLY